MAGKIPSFRDIHQTQPPKEPTTLKDALEQATTDAVQQLTRILSDTEASPQAKISAATRIISIAHGKDGLKIDQRTGQTQDEIAKAIRSSRFPKPPDLILKHYIDTHTLTSEALINHLTQLTHWIQHPDDIPSDTPTTS